jgi:hypothetical protein
VGEGGVEGEQDVVSRRTARGRRRRINPLYEKIKLRTSMNSTIPEPSNTATVESVSTAMSCSVSAVDGVSRVC